MFYPLIRLWEVGHLTSRIIREEVPPTCHPLSAANKLVAAPGLLTGTNAANSGRISVGGKSPLTGGIKESNSGGIFSQKLARLNIKALVLEGQPKSGEFFIIKISPNRVEFFPAVEYKTLGPMKPHLFCGSVLVKKPASWSLARQVKKN